MLFQGRQNGPAIRSDRSSAQIPKKSHEQQQWEKFISYRETRTHYGLIAPKADEHYWWKHDAEALCFDLELTAESELTNGAPLSRQWWDVEKLAESEYFVAITKPPGMYVVTDEKGLWIEAPTNLVHVANRRYELPCSDEPRQRGICHRLDSFTSGVQIFGKSWEAYSHFRKENTLHRMSKEYLALVDGRLGGPDGPNVGVIDVPMVKWRDFSRHEFGSIVCPSDGEPAVTKYKVLRQWRVPAEGDLKFWGKERWFTLVQIRILTGRTHQIRVHMAFIGHPLVGDDKYNPACYEFDYAITPRIFLHSYRIEFEDIDTSPFKASCDLSPDLQVVLNRLHDLSDASSENPMETTSNSNGEHFAFPGLKWLLERTKSAAPIDTSAQQDFECYRHPQSLSQMCLYCRQPEEACCSMVYRDQDVALLWTLRRCTGTQDACQSGNGSARWGPSVLWVPAGLQVQRRDDVEDLDVGELQDATPEELGEHWGKVSTKWTWAHNGMRQNGWINIHSDGIVSSKWGIGSWQLLRGSQIHLLLVTFHQMEHALRLCGVGSPIPYWEMVAKRRLSSESSLADPCNCRLEDIEDVLRPDAPVCCATRGWPSNGPTPTSGSA